MQLDHTTRHMRTLRLELGVGCICGGNNIYLHDTTIKANVLAPGWRGDSGRVCFFFIPSSRGGGHPSSRPPLPAGPAAPKARPTPTASRSAGAARHRARARARTRGATPPSEESAPDSRTRTAPRYPRARRAPPRRPAWGRKRQGERRAGEVRKAGAAAGRPARRGGVWLAR